MKKAVTPKVYSAYGAGPRDSRSVSPKQLMTLRRGVSENSESEVPEFSRRDPAPTARSQFSSSNRALPGRLPIRDAGRYAGGQSKEAFQLPPRELLALPRSQRLNPEFNTRLLRSPSTANRSWLYLIVIALISGAVVANWMRPSPIADRLSLALSSDPGSDQIALPTLPSRSRSQILHRVKRGETLDRIFQDYGFQSDRLEQAFSSSSGALVGIDRRQILPVGTRVSVTLDRHGEVAALSFRPHGQEKYLALRARSNGLELIEPTMLTAHAAVRAAVRADRVVRGVIHSSFSADAAKAGLPPESIDLLVDLFAGKIEFRRDLHKGDRFSIILGAPNTSSTQPQAKGVKAGPVVLAAALDVGGKRHVAVRYVGTDGKIRYFDDRGALFGETFLRYPVKFSRISSTFSDSRLHPVLKQRRPHLGVDFAAPTGTTVRAAGDGKIVFAGYKGPNGNMVEIRHNDRITTTYLHLSKIASGMRKGRAVAKGETIGAVGCTGLCSGPHLHFGLFNRGKYVDPLQAKLPIDDTLGRGIAIDRPYLDRVLFTLNHLLDRTESSVQVADEADSGRAKRRS